MQSNEPEATSGGRSRASAAAAQYGTIPLRSGIQDAVNSAIDNTHSDIDPHLVSKITEHVVSALKKEMLNSNTTNASQATSAPQQSSQTTASQSRQARSSSRVTPQHTPRFDPQVIPNEPPATTLYQPAPLPTRQAAPASPTSPASSHIPPRYTPPSPNRHDASSSGSSSPDPTYLDGGKNSRRDSKSSMSGPEDASGPRQRMRPVRIPSAVEETSLEKAWKPLFENGRPTARLGQFLRGLAKHLIEDCKPQHSIVVTPGKLADFFKVTELQAEMFPWTTVFGGKLTNLAISRLFLSLRCQHHLIQFGDQDTPTIPGLTPAGFETFMTTLIQAYPDQEYQRLSKAVKNMPISNADSPSERFPKELTRRLFPASGDSSQAQRLSAALSIDPGVQANYSNTMPPPPASHASNQSSNSFFAERDRNPHSSPSFSSAIDDEDLRAAPMPIERERKPYTAREGGGKVHEGSRGQLDGQRSESHTRSTRSNTNAGSGTAPFAQYQSTRPIDMSNQPPRSHRMSVNGPPTSRYMNSPGMPNPYTRSEGNNVSEIPNSFYASNLGDYDDQTRDGRRSFRRQTTEEDMTRGSGSYPRFDHPNSYNYGFRAGMDPPGNSFPGQTPSSHGSRY